MSSAVLLLALRLVLVLLLLLALVLVVTMTLAFDVTLVLVLGLLGAVVLLRRPCGAVASVGLAVGCPKVSVVIPPCFSMVSERLTAIMMSPMHTANDCDTNKNTSSH